MARQRAAESGHRVVVDDIGPSRKRLTITVPATDVAQQLETSLEALSAEAALPGFRPGRVPRRLIEKRFGPTMRAEAKNQIVASAYSQAVQDHKLSVLGEPEGGEGLATLELDPAKDLTFSLEVEVAPEFDLPSVDGLEIYKPHIDVTPEQVNEQIDRIKINEGALEPQDRAMPGDYCIGHGVMKTNDGKTVIDLDGAVIQVPPADKKGKGAILGVMVEDFGTQVGTPEPGQTLTIKATGPENHENEDARGKPLVITYKVARCERIVPATTEAILARFGMEQQQQLLDLVTSRLEQRARIEQVMALRQQVARHLIDSVSITLPERLSARQTERNIQRARVDLMYRGVDAHQIEEKLAEIRSASNAAAVRDLKLFFCLAKAAQSMNVQVTNEELFGRVAQMAAERGVRPDQLRRELEQRNQLGFVAQQIAEHKVLDALAAKAKVSEVSIEEFRTKTGAAGKKA